MKDRAADDFKTIRTRMQELFPEPRCPVASSRILRECMQTACTSGCPMEREPRTKPAAEVKF